LEETINLTERLLEQCKKGDERAQYALHQQYVHGMYNVAYRIVGNQFDAEDVVQEAFVKAFNKLVNLKEAKAFGSWLKQIVVNQAISNIRKHKHFKCALETVDVLPDMVEEVDVSDFPMEKVMRSIMELPQGARVVFTLRVIEGYKFNEIAQMTGQTENNCKVQFHRSKKLLNNKLKGVIYAE